MRRTPRARTNSRAGTEVRDPLPPVSPAVSRGPGSAARRVARFRVVDETIPTADHGLDARPLDVAVHLAPQRRDVDVDDVAARLVVHVPDTLADHRPRQQLARIAHE